MKNKTIEAKTIDIWKNILLKSVSGNRFSNAKTIKDTSKKYQVFEVLVAETLACIQPEMNWQVTVGNSDGGVDLIATSNIIYSVPFAEKNVDQVILGQVKRRSNGYRYDEFRNDIVSANEYYKSCYVSKGKSLLEILFVVSTEDKNNVKNLEKDLANSQEKRRPITLVAGISSPIHIIDAEEIIKYWKYNFPFVCSLISGFTSAEEQDFFKSYLNKVSDTYVQLSVNEIGTANMGEIVKVPVCIKISSFDIPLKLRVKWIPVGISSNILQLITPIELLEKESGFNVELTNEYHFTMFFRALQEGEWNLGYISVFIEDACVVERFPLGTIQFIRSLNPIFQEAPNNNISTEIFDLLTDASNKYSCSVITGSGGVGKSFLVNKIVILLLNQGYACVQLEHLHSFVSNGDFSRGLMCEFLTLYLHKPCFFNKVPEMLSYCLKGYYMPDWEDEIHTFFFTNEQFNPDIISSLFVALIIKICMKQPLIIWLRNLHWLSDADATIILKISQMLEYNRNFFPFHVRLILEGRKDEILIQNHKIFFPYAWENLQLKIKAGEYILKPWTKNDTYDFISSILDLPSRRHDYSLYKDLTQKLLENFSGVPLHITEQLRYLLQQGKLGLGADGQIYIREPNWKNLFNSQLKELINNRLIYFVKKHPTYGSWLILYTKFSAVASDTLKQVIYKNIKKIDSLAEEIALDSDFFKLSNNLIIFQHEYYVEVLKNMPIADDAVLNILLDWLLNLQQDLPVGDLLCKIELLQLMDNCDYEMLTCDAVKLISTCCDDTILLSLYSILMFVPETNLEQNNLSHYIVNYRLGLLTMRLGNYEVAKEYLHNVIKEDKTSIAYIQCCALAYQQLSNIDSVKFDLDSAIENAQAGILFIQNQRGCSQVYSELDDVEAMLLSRQSINQAFDGNWSAAMHYQKMAVSQSLKTHKPYVVIRIAYERCGLLLHKSLRTNICRLNTLYEWAKNIEEMYPTELYLIKVMELVGRLVLFQNDNAKIFLIQKESLQLESLLINKKSNYIVCLNYLVLGSCSLLLENSADNALRYFFRALESGLDSYREEMLWKCYINIAQLYDYNGEHEKALNYAKKGRYIITNILQKNHVQSQELEKIYRIPIQILKSIEDQAVISICTLNPPVHILETLSFMWNGQIIFLMK